MLYNAALLARLQALGPLPDATSPAADDFPMREFDELLQQLTEPLAPAHALALVALGPPPDTGSFGVEAALLSWVETLPAETLRDLLPRMANTEVKRLLEIRLANYFRLRS